MGSKLKAAAALFAASLSMAAAAQGPAKGKLLVAAPTMPDPNFKETVVLLLHHDENGTIGVAVNRPTWLEPREVAPDVGELGSYDGTVFHGGPLAPTQLIFLVRNPPTGTFDAPPITDEIYASGNLELLPRLAGAPDAGSGLRLYAGHLEWAAGQVEREVASKQWLVVEGSPDRIFSSDPEELWPRLSAQGDELLVERRWGSVEGRAADGRARAGTAPSAHGG
jgi:putative transcriptional regulator